MIAPDFEAVFAAGEEDVRAAQRLRYSVFVGELGGDGPGVDHAQGLECDEFDVHSKHLLLLDRSRPGARADQIVGVYRLLDTRGAAAAGGYYTEREYDLTALHTLNLPLLEIGRSCLHPDYRGGAGMFHLWAALGAYVSECSAQILFGTASFHGTDIAQLAPSLSALHHRHLAPKELRVTAKAPATPMDLFQDGQFDRKSAMRDVPALIKAYLRLGGSVGAGAYLDHAFNTTDVCLVLPVAQMNARQKRLYMGDKPQ